MPSNSTTQHIFDKHGVVGGHEQESPLFRFVTLISVRSVRIYNVNSFRNVFTQVIHM